MKKSQRQNDRGDYPIRRLVDMIRGTAASVRCHSGRIEMAASREIVGFRDELGAAVGPFSPQPPTPPSLNYTTGQILRAKVLELSYLHLTRLN